MRRVSGEGGDVFRPKGQLAREIRMAKDHPQEVARILGERLSPERRARIDEVVSSRTRRLAVAVEGVGDPHNTAAVVRTAEGFGLQTVHVIERGDKFLSSRKVTQGAHKWVDLAVWADSREFASAVRGEGKKILVADSCAAMSLEDLDPTEPMALVFGNEHEGVSPEMRGLSDGSFCIPMSGFSQSLNVSVAAGVAMAFLRRESQGDLDPRERAVLLARFYLRAVRSGYDIVVRGMGS